MKATATYRDIPFSEVVKCFTAKYRKETAKREADWELLRGTTINIKSEPTTVKQWEFWSCGGPFYMSALGGRCAVCPHVATINIPSKKAKRK